MATKRTRRTFPVTVTHVAPAHQHSTACTFTTDPAPSYPCLAVTDPAGYAAKVRRTRIFFPADEAFTTSRKA